MEKARLIVAETEEWVCKDFEITCYGEHISLRFTFGKRRNKIVVQMVEKEIHVTTTNRYPVIINVGFFKIPNKLLEKTPL